MNGESWGRERQIQPASFECGVGTQGTASPVKKRLAAKISKREGESYADAIEYTRTQVSFALLRSSTL